MKVRRKMTKMSLDELAVPSHNKALVCFYKWRQKQWRHKQTCASLAPASVTAESSGQAHDTEAAVL